MATKKSRESTAAPTEKKGTPKDRGNDNTAVASNSKPEEVCLKSFLNNGNEITLTNGSTVKVRDLPFSVWLDGMSTVIPVLASLSEVGMDEKQILMVMAKDEEIRNRLFEMMHCGCKELSVDEIKNLGAADTLRLLIGFKEVIDFNGVKELFTRLVSPS